MNSRQVIAEAWAFTQENKKLMWWYAFFPALLTTLIGILYLTYQFFAFKNSALFDNTGKSVLSEIIGSAYNFLQGHGGLLVPTAVTIIIVLILYALLPTLCQGALIQLIARKKKGEAIRTSEGISLGMLSFLPLLEYHLLIKTFSLVSLFTEAAFVLRILGPDALGALLPIFILIGVIGFFLTLLFTYSEFFIVLDKKSVLTAIGRSVKLVILSWQHTFLIGILMLIIGIRIIINIVAVLLVPALLFFGAGFIATVTFKGIGIAIGVIFAFIGLFVASYFTGILNVFANAVWTFTFMELMGEKQTQEVMQSS